MKLLKRVRGWTRLAGEIPAEAVAAEARSHAGHVRMVNEDRYLSLSRRGLWAVADGMGGHAHGITAASIAIRSIEDMAESEGRLSDDCVRSALEHANQLICALGRPGKVSGTTIVAARRDGDEMIIYWAGDSRAYRVSRGKAQIVTHDHSIVQELIDAGVISKAEALTHPQSHVVTRALGAARKLELDVMRVPFRPGDSILLCSDGFSRSLTAMDLTSPSPTIAASADRLLVNALRRDGSDNTTFILIQRRA